MRMLMGTQINIFELSRRDLTCLSVAAGLHMLLFLWTSSPMKMLDADNKDLGEKIVQVEFRTDADIDYRPHREVRSASKGFLSQVSTFFAKNPKIKVEEPTLSASAPAAEKIKILNPWESVKNNLENKDFNEKSQFTSAKKNEEKIDIAKGGSQPVAFQKLSSENAEAKASLKSKDFQIAKEDTPFQLTPSKNIDTLAMANAVPIQVGRKTSSDLKSFKDLDSSPNLKTKSLDSSKGSGNGFGNLTESGRGTSDKLMSTGSGSSKISGVSNSPFGSTLSSAGQSASGKSYGGGASGFRPSEMSGAEKSPSIQPAGGAESGGASKLGQGKDPFTIEGALRNRKILRKTFPTVTMDARVGLKFRVDWAGSVLDGIVVVISSGSPTFDQKVIEALKKWVFSRLPSDRSNEIQEGVINFVFRGV